MMTRFVRTTYLGLLVLATGCDGWKTPSGPAASLDADLRQSLSRWGTVPIGPTPAQPAALVDLGQALMFDKVLSGNRDIACATCHNPASHAGDGLARSEEHTSELQSRLHLVCRLLLEKKKKNM